MSSHSEADVGSFSAFVTDRQTNRQTDRHRRHWFDSLHLRHMLQPENSSEYKQPKLFRKLNFWSTTYKNSYIQKVQKNYVLTSVHVVQNYTFKSETD